MSQFNGTRDLTSTRDRDLRSYYTKPEWTGFWYVDGDGLERCTSEWVGPCQHCHKPIPPAFRDKTKAQPKAQPSAQDIIEAEALAETAHAEPTQETEVGDQQFVYVRRS